MSASPCSSTKAPWSPPQVLIDDNSERIIYTAGWFPAGGVTPAGWGSSLTDSTHQLALTDVSSGFSFNFTGTSVSLLGDVFSYSDDVGEANLEMSGICLIDGEQRGGLSGAPHLLCGIDNLPDGDHEISYSIRSVSTSSSLILYLDAIQYTPSPNTNTNGTNIYMVDSCDTSIDFGKDLKNWKAFNSTLTTVYSGLPLGFRERFDGITTSVAGTHLEYTFTGTKLQWMATILSPEEGGPSTLKAANAVFTIDNSPNLNWTVPVPWWSNETVYNQLVFETPDPLTSGEHTLSVTYLGDSESMPLSLSYFNVFDGVETVSHPVKTSHSRLAPILGGALGGLVGLLLVMLTGWVTYHRRQRIMEKRAWDTTWQKRQPRVEALEMSPRPEKLEKS